MYKKPLMERLRKLLHSKTGLAIPVTYLILFVSLMAVISATYTFAIVKIGAREAILKNSVATQNMLILDNAVHSVAWSFGASEVIYMDDCGGVFHIEPTAKNLVLNLTDDQTFYDVVFSSSVGQALYELVPSESSFYGFFIRGDERAVINQSEFTMTQLYVRTGDNAQEMILCYRPLATVAVISSGDGKPLNLIRIHIINFNSSQNLMLREKFYLKVTSLNVTAVTSQYEFNHSVSSLALKAVFDEAPGIVWLPISSNGEGVVVNLEIVVCNVKVQRAEV